MLNVAHSIFVATHSQLYEYFPIVIEKVKQPGKNITVCVTHSQLYEYFPTVIEKVKQPGKNITVCVTHSQLYK